MIVPTIIPLIIPKTAPPAPAMPFPIIAPITPATKLRMHPVELLVESVEFPLEEDEESVTGGFGIRIGWRGTYIGMSICSHIFLSIERFWLYLLILKSDSISNVSIIFVAFQADSSALLIVGNLNKADIASFCSGCIPDILSSFRCA